jgi:probable rRNA maturation factor
MIDIVFEDTEILDVNPEFFVSWLSKVVSLEGQELGEICLIFCSDDYLLEVNRKHLDHDYYTDIITFDYTEDGVVSGDLFISVDRVLDNAKTLDEMFHVELYRVVVHGVLHLLGYKDKSENESLLMREKESWALSLIVPRETLG